LRIVRANQTGQPAKLSGVFAKESAVSGFAQKLRKAHMTNKIERLEFPVYPAFLKRQPSAFRVETPN
jgi:hypothetical protein